MRKRSLARDRIITILLIALIILLGLGIVNQTHPLGFNFLGLNLAPTPITLQQPSSSGLISSTKPYTAEIPGPGCNSDRDLWVGGAQRHEKNGDVDDSNTSFACRKDGLLIIRFTPYYVFGTAFFRNRNPEAEPLANNYRVQITARIIHGDPNATVDLSVHGQSRYGSDSIMVSSDGSWSEETFDNLTSAKIRTLTSGKLARSPTTITIIAEVHGASVSATINDIKMKTVKDPDYNTTSYIGMGISDVGAASSPEALFSHFVYTPLGAI